MEVRTEATASTPTAEDATDALVHALFEGLNAADIRYALLRNYEAYPRFGNDVDLVIDPRDLEELRQVAAAAAGRAGFDAVTACGHWAQSGEPVQDFWMFRFYRLRDLAFIKLDAFFGHVVAGQPFLDAAALLAGSRLAPCGRFRIVDPRHGELWRMMQLAAEAARAPSNPRVAHYRAQILACATAAPGFAALVADRLGPDGARALAALEANELPHFGRSMRRARRLLLLRLFAQSPPAFLRRVFRRVSGVLRTRFVDPCGFTLRIAAETGDDSGRARLTRALDRLQAADFVRHVRITGAGAGTLSRRERLHVLHLSGVVVELVSPGGEADLDLAAFADEADLSTALAWRIVDRHPRIEPAHA